MKQGLATKIEVDKGRDYPNLGATKPQSYVLRPVLHKEGQSVSMFKARTDEKMCQPIAVIIQLEQ